MNKEEEGGRRSNKFLQFLTFPPKAQMSGATFHYNFEIKHFLSNVILSNSLLVKFNVMTLDSTSRRILLIWIWTDNNVIFVLLLVQFC